VKAAQLILGSHGLELLFAPTGLIFRHQNEIKKTGQGAARFGRKTEKKLSAISNIIYSLALPGELNRHTC